ncbi:MAG: 3'-5' exonuclease [Bacteroidetes bacterium]|nr:3'-5' exonuclease [Bacteroidota bacterium]
MNDFTAIDFETANYKGFSICQIGLVRVENNEVVKTINQLICPPGNYYISRFIDIHGITPEHTAAAPTFEEVWGHIKKYIEDQVLVAHNASFDCSCLKQVLAYYDLAEVKYERQCTYKIYKKGLSKICEEQGIQLNHHDALSDAMACAELYKRYLNK